MTGIPEILKDELKCSECHNYLSYFPIQQTSTSVYCGRCCNNIKTKEKLIRNRIYEIVAAQLQFPCSYSSEGCLEILSPSEVPDHEAICEFKTFNCPVREERNCFWNGPIKNVVYHCDKNHENLIMKNNEFEIDLTNSHESENLAYHENKLFRFRRNYNSNTKHFGCSLETILKQSDKTECQLVFFNRTQNLSAEFPFQSESSIHDISCETVQKMLNSSGNLFGKLKFTVDCKSFTLEGNSNFQLECAECQNYMTSPIRLCKKGHNVCSYCKINVMKCPICEDNVINYIPDFAFQSIITELTIACNNNALGCTYHSKLGSISIENHKKLCQFALRQCPLKINSCYWSGFSNDFHKHITLGHSSILKHSLEVNHNFRFVNSYVEDFSYITQYSGKYFKLLRRNIESKMYWTVQLVSENPENQLFRYEITIKDQKSGNFIMSVKQNCSMLKEQEQCFQNSAEYFVLDWYQIKSNTNNNQFWYKVDIIKV